MTIAMTRRPFLVAMLLLLATLVVTLAAPMRAPGAGLVSAATGPCGTGTAFFGSAADLQEFHVGDTWQGGTFTSIVSNDEMRARMVVTGDTVGRFPHAVGAQATITFAQPILVTGILWYDNDPNPGEAGWSLNGIQGPLTGHESAACTTVSFVTDTVVIASGDDSGGIDFWFQPAGGGEGCTPGYWKQAHHFDSWVATGYSPNQTLESVFDVPDQYGLDNVTLVQALSLKGGSDSAAGARLLLHHAVASLLNAANPGVSFGDSAANVISTTNAALATGDRGTMLAQKDDFDRANNQGCPLN